MKQNAIDIFLGLCLIGLNAVAYGVIKDTRALNTRIDHLYTEEGQLEMKCRAKGGELKYEFTDKGWEKFGCYSTNKSEEVKIEI